MVRVLLAALAALLTLLATPAHGNLKTALDTTAVPGCDFLDPEVCLLPWPNDHFTRVDAATDTGRRVDLLPTSTPRNLAGRPIDVTELNRNDGFSPGSAILAKIPGLNNEHAFRNSGLVPETDMARAYDPGQAVVVIDADTLERHLVWAELDLNAQTPGDRVLIVRPGRNFLEGHRSVVALRDLRKADGTPIHAGNGFRVYRDRVATLNPAVEQRRPHMEEIFETLRRAGIDRRSLYLAWDFTVASERDRSERMLHMRDTAFAELGDGDLADLVPSGSAPAFTVDAVEDTPTDTRVARIVSGSFQVPCFLSLPGCPPGARMAYTSPSDTLPERIPGNTQTATYTCVVPRTAAEGGPPARPSLYGHGLLGGQGEVESGAQKDMVGEHNFLYCATDWYGFATEDVGSVALTLLDASNFPLLVDRMQQGFLAQLFLGRLLVHPQGLSADPAFQAGGRSLIDTTRLYYDGNSQGGIMGGALIAVSPDAERAVLGVPAMNYSTLLQRSVDFESHPDNPCPPTDPAKLMENLQGVSPDDPESFLELIGFSYACPLYASYPNVKERQLLIGLMQQLWDRGEANGYAHHMTGDPLANTPAHEVLMHVALGDHQVAQVAAEVQARTIGAHVRPVAVDPGRSHDVEPQYAIPEIGSWPFHGSVYELWDSGPLSRPDGRGTDVAPVGTIPPRAGRDPHGEPRSTRIARRQKSEFMRPGGAAIDVCGGGPCYSRGWKGSE